MPDKRGKRAPNRTKKPELTQDNFIVSFSNAILGKPPVLVKGLPGGSTRDWGLTPESSRRSSATRILDIQPALSSKRTRKKGSMSSSPCSSSSEQSSSSSERMQKELVTRDHKHRSGESLHRQNLKPKSILKNAKHHVPAQSDASQTESSEKDVKTKRSHNKERKSSSGTSDGSISISSGSRHSHRHKKSGGSERSRSEACSDDISSRSRGSSVKAAEDSDMSWSLSTDALLRAMKEGGESWDSISGALSRRKKDVVHRWQFLKDSDRGRRTSTSSSSDSDGHDDTSTSFDSTPPSKGHASRQKKQGRDVESKRNSRKMPSGSGKKRKQNRGEVVSPRNDPLSGDEASPECSSSSYADEDSNSDSSSCADFALSQEDSRQKHFMVRNIWSGLYPNSVHPQPDRYFDQNDCDVLAAVDSKYKTNRWLEMQANFYNVTGRMVPIDILRSKFEDAEKHDQ